MVERENVEIKVGLFVFIGMIILFIIVFSIGDFYLWNPGYQIKVYFQYANGLELAAPVRFAGVGAGEVKEIHILPNPKEYQAPVELSLWIQQRIAIPADSEVMINTLGLLGEKYVEIVPGTSQARILKPGDSVRGSDPLSTEVLVERAYKIASKVERTIDALNSVVEDPDFLISLKQTISNTNEATESAKTILAQLQKGQGTLGRFIYEDSIYRNLEELTLDLKQHPWKLLQRPKEEKKKK